VAIQPGWTAVQVMPWRALSSATLRVRPHIAALAAAWPAVRDGHHRAGDRGDIDEPSATRAAGVVARNPAAARPLAFQSPLATHIRAPACAGQRVAGERLLG
jgi:hypothetical protein